MFSDQFSDYKWIKVKRWQDDESKTLQERFDSLQKHHLEETTFLIEKVRELAKIIDTDGLTRLLYFLDRLEWNKIDFSLKRSRDSCIMVLVHPAPCEYWEVEFFRPRDESPRYMEVQATTDFENIYYDENAEEILTINLFQKYGRKNE